MRPGKPLGLTLALVACVVLYGLWPLAQALLFLSLAARTNETLAPQAWLALVLSLGFLALLVPAWLGRPPQIRWVLSIAVIGLTIFQLALVIGGLTSPPDGVALPDAGSAISRTVNFGMLCVYIPVPLYIVWYLNRYPSRVYYGGRKRHEGHEAKS